MTDPDTFWCTDVPAVPTGFKPSHTAAFLYQGHVCTSREGYGELIRLVGLNTRYKFITRGLTPIFRHWRPRGRLPYYYDLSVIRFVTQQSWFEKWMLEQIDIGPNTVRDVRSFIQALEDADVLDPL
jgi:hypothetical protein